ncbi:helix-turn-helix domain-containing protein [Desulfocurvibacter africanus]|uniref:helix-turn-helix domain-containing protein n=1 Tax=Desulfocurvibacter africanus TaxID=873 RepID=UPI002FDAA5D8
MYDLIVIGAGPAGSMAARQAAQSGLKTLLLDKDQFPRAKPCGGGLTLRALDALASVGLRLPESVIERPLMGARITIADRSVEVRKPWPVAVTVLRERFDSLLVSEALSLAGGNRSKAARMLGITRPTLLARIDKYGLKTETLVTE